MRVGKYDSNDLLHRFVPLRERFAAAPSVAEKLARGYRAKELSAQKFVMWLTERSDLIPIVECCLHRTIYSWQTLVIALDLKISPSAIPHLWREVAWDKEMIELARYNQPSQQLFSEAAHLQDMLFPTAKKLDEVRARVRYARKLARRSDNVPDNHEETMETELLRAIGEEVKPLDVTETEILNWAHLPDIADADVSFIDPRQTEDGGLRPRRLEEERGKDLLKRLYPDAKPKPPDPKPQSTAQPTPTQQQAPVVQSQPETKPVDPLLEITQPGDRSVANDPMPSQLKEEAPTGTNPEQLEYEAVLAKLRQKRGKDA